MKFLLMILLLSYSYAQTPEAGFVEISPEQEKKIQLMEERKKLILKKQQEKMRQEQDAKIIAAKKIEEENRKREEEKLAASKKAEEEKRKLDEVKLAALKKAEEEKRKLDEAKLAASKKAEEERRKREKEKLQASKKAHKEKRSELTRKLIKEKERKLKEAANFTPGDDMPSTSNSASSGGTCPKTPLATSWEREFKESFLRKNRHNSPDPLAFRTGPDSYTEENLQNFLCSCRFKKTISISSSLKVLSISGFNSSNGNVTVNVKESGDVALILSAYESIKWKINQNDANIIGVVVLGFDPQELTIGPDVPRIISTFKQDDVCDYFGSRISMYFDKAVERSEGDTVAEIHARRRIRDLSVLLFGKEPHGIKSAGTIPQEIAVD